MLSMEGEELSENDSHMGLLLVDATWRYAAQCVRQLINRLCCRSALYLENFVQLTQGHRQIALILRRD